MNRSLRGALALVVALLLPAMAHATIYTVTDQDSLWVVATKALPTDVIQGSGSWPAVQLPPNIVHAAPGVTIQPVPGQTWTIASLGVNGSGYTIKGIDFAMAPNTYGLDVPGQDIVFDGVKVHQADTTAMNGAGVYIRGARNITFKNSEVSWVGVGVVVADSDTITIAGNTIHDVNVDAIDMAGTLNSVVSGNRITNSHPNLAAGDHPDCIQVYNGTINLTGNLKILGNWCERGTGGPMQGIFVEDGNGVDIEDNYVGGPMANGVGLARTKNGTLAHNFIQSYAQPDDTGSRIIVRQEADLITIKNNASPIVAVGVTGEAQPTNVTPTGQQLTTLTTAAVAGDYAQYLAWRIATGAGATPAPGAAPVSTPTPPPTPVPTPVPVPAPAPTPAPAIDPLQPALDAATAQTATLKAKITKAQAALLAYPSNTAKQLQNKIANALAALK